MNKYVKWLFDIAIVVFLVAYAITYYSDETPHYARFGILLVLASLFIFSVSYFDFFKIEETLE